MRITLQETLEKTGILVIDGSMSTALEALGCDLNDSLWTARVLAEQPDLVRQVHLNYFRAGADCSISSSYQATIPGLTARGYSTREAEDFIARSVELLLEARESWWQQEGRDSGRAMPLCLGAVGPYGAYLADGSEYRGNYGVSDDVLRQFHRRRMEILWEAKPSPPSTRPSSRRRSPRNWGPTTGSASPAGTAATSMRVTGLPTALLPFPRATPICG